MITGINLAQLYVLDQQQALDYYVGTLGLDVKADYDLGFMRWLTVGPKGDDSTQILLELPGPPAHDEQTAAQVRELVTKGAAGWIGFRVDNARQTHDDFAAKGVTITQEPIEHFYGIDFSIRDPFGNNLRVVELKPIPPGFQPEPGTF